MPKFKVDSTGTPVSHKNALIIASGVLAATVLLAGPSFAQSTGGDIFSTLQTKSTSVFTSVRNLCYVLGAFGLISIAVMAFFGRFNWKHLAGLIGGLILIAAAAGFITFATTNSTSVSEGSSTPTFTDTLK